MRFYRLTLYNENNVELVKFQSGTPFPRHNNFTPLQIEFEKSTYEAGDGSQGIQVNFWINLHLQSLSTFVGLQKIGEMKMKFECGFDKESRIVKKLGYITPVTQVLYSGRVASITGNFTTKESFIHISGTNFQKNDEDLGVDTFLQIRKGSLLFGSGEANYSGDDNITYAQGIINCYERFYRNNQKSPTYIIHNDLANKKWERELDYAILLKGKTNDYERAIAKLENVLQRDLGIVVQKTDSAVVFIPDPVREIKKDKDFGKVKPSVLDGQLANKKMKLISEAMQKGQKRGGTTSEKSFGVAKRIDYSELLDYPVFNGFSQRVDMTIALRPDINLGSVVEMPSKAIISKLGSSLREGFIASEDAGKLRITAKGKYVVIGVMHRGNFYGKAPTNWATHLSLLPDNFEDTYNKALKG